MVGAFSFTLSGKPSQWFCIRKVKSQFDFGIVWAWVKHTDRFMAYIMFTTGNLRPIAVRYEPYPGTGLSIASHHIPSMSI